MNRTDEIKMILGPPLNNHDDIIHYILDLEKQKNQEETRVFWDYMQRNNEYFVNPYFKHVNKPVGIIINLHQQIRRMNGSLQNVRDENRELKEIEKNNNDWAEAWMRGVRF